MPLSHENSAALPWNAAASSPIERERDTPPTMAGLGAALSTATVSSVVKGTTSVDGVSGPDPRRSPVLVAARATNEKKTTTATGSPMSFLNVRRQDRASLSRGSGSSFRSSTSSVGGAHGPRLRFDSSTTSTCAAANAGAGRSKRTVLIDGFEFSEDDENDMGNGCGEGVSRNSSEDDEPDEELLLASLPQLHDRFSAACAAATASSPPAELTGPLAEDVHGATARPDCSETSKKGSTTAFSLAVMHAIRKHSDVVEAASPLTGSPSAQSPLRRNRAPNGLDTSTTGAAAADGVDDSSTVLSGLQLMIQQHDDCRAAAQKTGCNAFLNQFAPLYEIAIFEIIMECERCAGSASAVDREGPVEALRSRNSVALAVSAHSFDSPVSFQSTTFPSFSKPLSGIAGTHASATASGNGGPKHTVTHPRTVSLPFSFSFASSPSGAKQPQHGLLPQHHLETPTAPSAPGHLPAVHSFASFTTGAAPTMAASVSGGFANAGGSLHTGKKLEYLPPAESVQRLLCALDGQMQYQESAPLVFMAALAYLSRFATKCASSHGSITSANWFRMTLISLLTASKMYNEYGSRKLNRIFAGIAGIALPEINKLELDFLYLLDFELLLEEKDVEEWVQWMEALALRHNMFTPLKTFMMGDANSNLSNDQEHSVASSFATGAAGAAFTGTEGFAAPAATMEGFLRSASNGDGESSSDDTATRAAAMPFFLGGPSRHFSDLQSPTAMSAGSLAGPVSFPAGRHTAALNPSPSSSVVAAPYLQATDGSFGGAVSLCNDNAMPATPLHAHLSAFGGDENFADGCGSCGKTESRLFSVVHAPAEPKTPPTVRELSRLGATPPSPLAPPMLPSASPVGFFKRGSNVGGGAGSSMAGRSHDFSGSNLDFRPTTEGATAMASHQRQQHPDANGRGVEPISRASGLNLQLCTAGGAAAVSAVKEPARRVTVETAAPTTTFAPAGSSWRGGGLNVMQRAREALNVAASLVRGQLNVMGETLADSDSKSQMDAGRERPAPMRAPATPPSPVPASTASHHRDGAKSSTTRQAGNGSGSERRADESTPPVCVSSSVVASAEGAASFYPTTSVAAVVPASRDEVMQEGESLYEEGAPEVEEEEDEEEGYWDEYGYYHYYDDEEGYYDEEGHYYTYEEDDARMADAEAQDRTTTSSLAARPLHAGVCYAHEDYGEEEDYCEEDYGDEDYGDSQQALFRPPPRTHSPPTV